MASPYEGASVAEWRGITARLVAEHPLGLDIIHDVALEAWNQLWRTTIGTPPDAILLSEIDPPAQIVGHFFEKLMARILANRFPGVWRGTTEKVEKDLVYLPNAAFSIEIKSSGQLGLHVFGNRSYGQELTDGGSASKIQRSGYFITANFFGRTLMLLRFGWIDHSDWIPQKSPTGQMAGLRPEVYQHKLVSIPGEYQLSAPIELLDGVGAKTAATLSALGIRTIDDLIKYQGSDPRVMRFREAAAVAYSRAPG